MQPKICINKSGVNIPVFSDVCAAEQLNKAYQIGTIYHNELFSKVGAASCTEQYVIHEIRFYSPSGWRLGYVNVDRMLGLNWLSFFEYAYQGKYSYGSTSCGTFAGYVFKVRRKCRIFEGKTEVTSIYPGDFVLTDGKSDGGLTHPYRLSIEGYVKGGKCYKLTNGWCDTDIEIGYSMASEVTTYGQW